MEHFFNREIDEVISFLKTDIEKGLTKAAAVQRLGEYGPNKIQTTGKKSFLKMFFGQFRSFMIVVLLIAAVISGIVGIMQGEGLFDTFIILGILILNALVGAFQEKKAENSLEALINLSAPETKVIREGKTEAIATADLVPGDLVILETGAIVPADIRLIEAINLKIQESSLTGESVPVDKETKPLNGDDIPLGDRLNMAFSGSTVTYGRGRGVVVNTGMKTEVGKIAGMLSETIDTQTPMSRRLEQLGKVLGLAALVICAVIFAVGVLYGNSVLSMFMTAVSLAVAAIPEGLPAVSTVVLAIGVQRMVKKNAIVRNLPSVETLGSATVICSDKTGTLTQNKMKVVRTYVNHRIADTGKNENRSDLNTEEKLLLSVSVLCADVQVTTKEDGKKDLKGDPTETALIDFGMRFGYHKDEAERKNKRVSEIPFDSERKRMTTVNRLDGQLRINVKGGLDEILSVCNRIAVNGEVKPITGEDKTKIHKANDDMAGKALRVLAMAYRDLPGDEKNITGELEKDLIFIGMLGMIDPARPEVVDAVRKCNTAGIRPVMITGDHKATAVAIAGEIGIYRHGDIAITGSELEKMKDEDFKKDVSKFTVYARVAPEHKVKIVKAWQGNGEVVAMTGDGVNDAPALRQADIGAAMGITGTDVAKGAADMILTDDNFATIVSAVEEGRRIYDNIKKAIQFLLSTNIGEIFLLLVTSVFNMGTPLLPIHILWVNLVTDSLPALALSVDPPEKDIMERKPSRSKKGFMTNGMIWRIIYQGVMLGSIPLAAFVIGSRSGQGTGQTMAFATLMFVQLVHVRNLHSITRSSLAISPLKNKPLIGAIFVSVILALIVLLIPPVQQSFRLVPLNEEQWITVILMSFIPIVIVDIFKLLKLNGKDE
jgi:Ca2+-transporting ATPase